MHNELGVKVSPPFFLHPALHPPHRSPPRNDRGQKWPKAVKTGAQGEAFTRNTLYFKRLCVNRREHRQGEAFTRNTLTLNTLQAKSEEVKAKSRKTPDARASRVRVGRSPRANLRPSWEGGEKTPLGAPPSREKIVTSQGAPRPSSLSEQRRIVEILDRFDTLTNSISEGLPKESALRRKLYEYYRDALLRFPPTGAHGLRGSRHNCCCPTCNTSKPSTQTQAHYKVFGVVVYFADPYVSCQKGAIENTNSSDSIFPNKPTSMISQTKRWQVYRRKSTVDPDKS